MNTYLKCTKNTTNALLLVYIGDDLVEAHFAGHGNTNDKSYNPHRGSHPYYLVFFALFTIRTTSKYYGIVLLSVYLSAYLISFCDE